MDCSAPGFPVYHLLPELSQNHVHWVSDAIEPSHPLSSPSLPAFCLSQHQDLFQWVSPSHQWYFTICIINSYLFIGFKCWLYHLLAGDFQKLPRGFSGGASGKEPDCQCRRHKRCGFNSWVGKIPWKRAWKLTPLFLPGEVHGQRSLVGYSSWGRKDTTEVT